MITGKLIYVSLGSNVSPEENINRAITAIKSKLKNCSVSSIYRSPAVGMSGADFLNAVVGGYTPDTPEVTRHWLNQLETAQGRIRTSNRFSDRTIDLDLLLYDKLITPELPHRDIAEQAYVLEPLWEIAPDLIHPVLKLTMRELRSRLIDEDQSRFNALVRHSG